MAIGAAEIAESFARIEDELIASMMRNLDAHRVAEAASGMEWAQWQALQLQSLDEYARGALAKYGREFDGLNSAMENLIADRYRGAGMEQERRILEAMRRGWDPGRKNATGFLEVPHERLDALIRATHSDMMQAEYATLRRAQDVYRDTIFNAQVYAQSGAGTYEKAIDMATKDFLAKGIDGIVYSNGSRHSIREYASMAIRTSTKRAAFAAEGDMRREWGVNTVIVSYREDACADCMEWVGEVLVDDVYSGGTEKEAREGHYTLLSEAMDAGLFHPNCRDIMTTYFEGVTEIPDRPSKGEREAAEAREEEETAQTTAAANEARYERLSAYSLDEENAARYAEKAGEWGGRADITSASLQGEPTFAEQVSDATQQVRDRVSNDVTPFEAQPIDFDYVMARGGVTTEEAAESIRLAEQVFAAAAAVEPEITASIVSAADEIGAVMDGLDYRLKQPTSLAGKIASKGGVTGSFAGAADGITDAMRYTAVLEEKEFTSGYYSMREKLASEGYNEVRCKNFYQMYADGKSPQKAVQCLYRDEAGHTFELQYHTPESLGAKKLNHPRYNEQRMATTAQARRDELEAQMREISTNVPDPKGVFEIESYSLIGR